MEPRLSLVTLGVADLPRAVRFYEEVLKLPRIPTPPVVAFFEMGKTWLSLFPRMPPAAAPNAAPRPVSRFPPIA